MVIKIEGRVTATTSLSNLMTDQDSQIISTFYDSDEAENALVKKANARALRLAAAQADSVDYRPKQEFAEWYFTSESDPSTSTKSNNQAIEYCLHRLYRKHRYQECFDQAVSEVRKYRMNGSGLQPLLDIALRAGCKLWDAHDDSSAKNPVLMSWLIQQAEDSVSDTYP